MNRRTRTAWPRLVAFVVATVVALTAACAFAEEPQDADEPDYVALAAMLVGDGHYERAERELSKVDTSDEAQFDRATYFTLRGLIALEKRAYKVAIGRFEEAIAYGKTDDMMFVYLAQAYYGTRNWERTILSVRNSDEAGEKIADLYLMQAHAHRQLDEHAAAWEALQAGAKRFPDRHIFLRQQVFLLVEMGLYQRAAHLGEVYLSQSDSAADDYLALGEAFRRAGAHERAQKLLEEAMLRFGGEPEVIVHLAHAYIATGQLITAGELMQRAAEFNSDYIVESAELYRRAGSFDRALYMNAQVDAQSEKFKQRVAILLDQKRFEQLSSLEQRLDKLGLLEDQNILYTLAYARFQTGDYEDAERLLKQVTDADLFESAVQLRKTVQMCRQEPGRC